MDIGHGGSTIKSSSTCSFLVLMLYDSIISKMLKNTTSESYGWNDIGNKGLSALEIKQAIRCSKISQLSLICRTKISSIDGGIISWFGGQRNNAGLIRTFAGIICKQYICTKNPINNSIKNRSRPVALRREHNFNGYYSINMHIIHLPFTNFRKIYLTLCKLNSLATRIIHKHHNKTQENSIFHICHKTRTDPILVDIGTVVVVRGKGKPLPSCRIAYPKKGSFVEVTALRKSI
ncbi:hypothetical protein ACJIZ3_002375 [Penstemon smallii]|uniref:Uncharacterized protein n=1 Tax=Penstemon smallii TaxID=265156 RepID=A0ABD3U9H5_9LAMI